MLQDFIVLILGKDVAIAFGIILCIHVVLNFFVKLLSRVG